MSGKRPRIFVEIFKRENLSGPHVSILSVIVPTHFLPRLKLREQTDLRDLRSNIPFCLKEFPRAKPEGTPEGEEVYLTVYPSRVLLRTVYHFNSHKANISLISLIDN